MKFKYLALLLLSAVAQAATVYPLPDPAIFVNPNYGNTTTIVTIAGVTYRGPSAFYYVSECAKADGARYHCDVLAETDVLLKASDGSQALVTLTIQSAAVLITSGHNYWRNTDTVLNGSVKLL